MPALHGEAMKPRKRTVRPRVWKAWLTVPLDPTWSTRVFLTRWEAIRDLRESDPPCRLVKAMLTEILPPRVARRKSKP